MTVLFLGAPWAIVVMAATMEAAKQPQDGSPPGDGGQRP
jgi:hypothetical protein